MELPSVAITAALTPRGPKLQSPAPVAKLVRRGAGLLTEKAREVRGRRRHENSGGCGEREFGGFVDHLAAAPIDQEN
ncbi:MAG TPA: hypothetical protein VKE94_17560 [Gemmataceae bacterium]|nr:hypothetical protein [Gemmataceae bacterium]